MTTRGPGPLYRQIADWVLERISAGDLRPGDPLESELELCKRFGVSRITVRASLKELEQQGVVERFAGKGTYVKSPPVAAPVQAAQPTVAFVVNTASDPWVWPVISGAEATLREFGFNLVVGDANHDVDEEERLVRNFESQPGVKGLLLVGIEEGRDVAVVRDLKARGTPFVQVDHYIPQLEADVVVSDDHGGAYVGADHLLQLGHRTILVLAETTELTSSIAERNAGIRKACRDHGLPLSCCIFQVLPRLEVRPGVPNDAVISSRIDLIAAQLRSNPDITAVFGLNDVVAMNAVQAARRLGLRVPEDISVVGFGDIFHTSTETPMTNLYVDRTGLGASAARTLLARLASPGLPPQRTVLPVRFMVRASTAPVTSRAL